MTEYMQTESLYYDSSSATLVYEVKLSITGTTIGTGDFRVSTDGGSTWTTIVAFDTWTATTQGNDLRLYIDNTLGGEWPTAWGTWGGATTATFTITNIQLEYRLVEV